MSSEPGNGMSTRDLLLELRDEMSGLRDDLRDTRHQIRSDVRAVELRVIELEAFRRDTERRLSGIDELVAEYVPVINHLSSQEKIQQAVRQALSESDTRGWTRRERGFAIVVCLCSIVGAAGTIVSLIVLGGAGGGA